jgi:phage repressor protein C with HTH and peptisase S24 domain
MVPLVPIKAQAGYSKGFANTDFINKLEMFPIVPGIDYRGAAWRYFEVEGDSMEDTFKEGQYLLASQVIQEDWQNIDNFYVYIIVTDDKVFIKRLAKVRGKDYWAAISDNESRYPQFALPVRDVKELWKYRRHIDWDASPPKKFEIKV